MSQICSCFDESSQTKEGIAPGNSGKATESLLDLAERSTSAGSPTWGAQSLHLSWDITAKLI
jgi:hypothetical protein